MNKLVSNILLISLLTACSSEVTRSIEPKTTAFGKLNEIVVIADDDLWESEVGDTFKYYFQSAYPIMPQPEPYFDLRHFSVEELSAEPMRKELRTYTILADLSDETSRTTKMVKKDIGSEKYNAILNESASGTSIGKEKWARGQMLIYLLGGNHHSLINNIREAFPAVSKRVNNHDKMILESSIYAVERENLGLSKKVRTAFGVEMKIPGAFVEALHIESKNFMWLRKDDQGITQSFLFKKVAYSDQNQLELKNLIKLRNELGKYVSTDSEKSTMIVNDQDLPVYEYPLKLDGHYAKELRGVWEMTNDFLGGSFVSYALVLEEKKEIIFIDAFVFAPGKDKRDYIQKLDFIVKQLKVVNDPQESLD